MNGRFFFLMTDCPDRRDGDDVAFMAGLLRAKSRTRSQSNCHKQVANLQGPRTISGDGFPEISTPTSRNPARVGFGLGNETRIVHSYLRAAILTTSGASIHSSLHVMHLF